MSKTSSNKFSRARFLYPDLSLQMQKDEEERVAFPSPDATEET